MLGSGTDPVHLDQDARLALGIAERGVGQAGALPEHAALELAHLLLLHLILLRVLPHHTQIILFLDAVVVFCKYQRRHGLERVRVC